MMEKFQPHYTVTSSINESLRRIEVVKKEIENMSFEPVVLQALNETTRLSSTHYSTKIEGNRLTLEQVTKVIAQEQPIKGRERDSDEVLGYYTALQKVEQWSEQQKAVNEKTIQTIHALVVGSGNEDVDPTPYREGQNVIKDGRTHAIVYLPPEAHDVSMLMQQFVAWIVQAADQQLQCPIVAGIAHYQFVTIHPYYDGNGRTARLLATLLLYEGGYRLKGLYTLDEHYAYNLGKYYESLTVGPSHNYYFGREEADITPWLEYFCEGMAVTCENGLQRVKNRI